MNKHLVNACLLLGWLMIVLGLSAWSIPAALVVGGSVLMGVTLLIAFRVGVTGGGRDQHQKG
jgi:hypothetical protein